MRHDPQGLERWAAIDLSDFRNSLRRQPDRMTWQRVWLYLLKIGDEEAAQLVRDQNPTLSHECAGDDHDDCHYPHCECAHHRATVLKAEGAPIKSCFEVSSEREADAA